MLGLVGLDGFEAKPTPVQPSSASIGLEQLAALIDALPLPAQLALDPTATFVRANRAFAEIAGVDGNGPAGYHFEFQGRVLSRDDAPLMRAIRGTTIAASTVEIVRADGARRQLITWAVPLNGDGIVRGALAVFHDAASVAQSEREFRLIADTMPQLVWTATPLGALDWYNAGWYAYTGQTPEEARGGGWRAVHHPDDLPNVERRWYTAIASGTPFEMEFRLRGRDGRYRWFLTRANPLHDAAGRIVKWYGTNTDVDDVRRAARTLQTFADVGEAISESLGLQATLDGVMESIVPAHADWAFISLIDDGAELRVAAVYHEDPAKRRALESQIGRVYARLSAPGGVAESLRTREPVLFRDVKYERAVNAIDREMLDVFWNVGVGSVLVLPLVVAGATRGTLTLIKAPEKRGFDRRDVPFFEELGRRIAPAIANAELYERERQVARRFQAAALPVALPSASGYAFDAIYEAGRTEALVGGDWYDAFRLVDGRIVISIGDVAGSGLEAAVTMASMRQTIRGVAQVHAEPALMLQAADRVLRSEAEDRFVTAFVGVIDPVTATLTYASAGHPPPFLRDARGEITLLAMRGLPLGLRDREDPQTTAVALAAGSLLVLYTDGLVESTRDVYEGETRLYAALTDPAVASAAKPAQAIHDVVLSGGEPRDDIAILAVAVTEREDAARWRFDVRSREAADAVRSAFVEALRRDGYPGARLRNAETVLGELLANAVHHAPGTVDLTLTWEGRHPVVHLVDRGPGFSFSAKLPPDVYSERGRGLYVVASLSEEFHVAREPGGGSHARAVLRPR